MIKNIDDLARFVEGGAEVLQKALTSQEDVEIKLVAGDFFSDDYLNTLKKSQFQAGKEEGNKIGYDFALKDIKKDAGIEIDGKDRVKILNALKEKYTKDAGIEPTKKVQELESQLKNVQSNYEKDIAEREQIISSLNGKMESFHVNNLIQKEMPELKALKKEQAAILFQNDFQVKKDGENVSLIKNGQPVTDKFGKPLPLKDVLFDYATSNGWIHSEGKGGDDNKGGSSDTKFDNKDEVFRYMRENNIDPTSGEGQQLLSNIKN